MAVLRPECTDLQLSNKKYNEKIMNNFMQSSRFFLCLQLTFLSEFITGLSQQLDLILKLLHTIINVTPSLLSHSLSYYFVVVSSLSVSLSLLFSRTLGAGCDVENAVEGVTSLVIEGCIFSIIGRCSIFRAQRQRQDCYLLIVPLFFFL